MCSQQAQLCTELLLGPASTSSPLNLGLSETRLTINRVLQDFSTGTLLLQLMGHRAQKPYTFGHTKAAVKQGKKPQWPEPGLRMGQSWWSSSQVRPSPGPCWGHRAALTSSRARPQLGQDSLKRRVSSFKVLTNQYSCCTCLTSLTETCN